MSEACEWDPARDVPAVLDGTWHAWAVWSCGTGPRNIHLCQDCADLPRFRRLKRRALARSEEGTMTKRVKKVQPPPEPPRDPRLVALAEQAQRAGWQVDWQLTGGETPWLRVSSNGVAVDAFSGAELNCYGHYYAWAGAQPARTPAEALRQAYAALGVALDQAEDAFGGTP